jgi:hypothetical protein
MGKSFSWIDWEASDKRTREYNNRVGSGGVRNGVPLLLFLKFLFSSPLFNVKDKTQRIDAGDAEYVECLHTNGVGDTFLLCGMGDPICTVDIYANGGGPVQLGCTDVSCSHNRAVTYFIESLGKNQFWANGCSNYKQMNKTLCQSKPGLFIGGEPSNFGKKFKGIYYFETKKETPFGLGIW